MLAVAQTLTNCLSGAGVPGPFWRKSSHDRIAPHQGDRREDRIADLAEAIERNIKGQRFGPAEQRAGELEGLNDEDKLLALFDFAITAPTLEAFLEQLAKETTPVPAPVSSRRPRNVDQRQTPLDRGTDARFPRANDWTLVGQRASAASIRGSRISGQRRMTTACARPTYLGYNNSKPPRPPPRSRSHACHPQLYRR